MKQQLKCASWGVPKSREFSLPALTFPHVFYFLLIFAVSMMQLRAMAALLGDSLNHQQNNIMADEGGDGEWLSFAVSTSHFAWIESTSVGSKS